MIPTLEVRRYVTPLREGGSLPAIVEADDGRMYVCKFAGAGQGPKALIAELLAGEIGRALGLPVPELALLRLDPAIGRNEGDPEIRDLLRASAGLNLGMAYLSRSFAFSPRVYPVSDPLASEIVWFDAYISNVDRTARNVNILVSEGQLWLIDHGAALYFHHSWEGYLDRSASPFPYIRDHVLLSQAADLWSADARLKPRLSSALLREIVGQVPEEWLGEEPSFASREEHRGAYLAYLQRRLEASEVFVREAVDARAKRL